MEEHSECVGTGCAQTNGPRVISVRNSAHVGVNKTDEQVRRCMEVSQERLEALTARR